MRGLRGRLGAIRRGASVQKPCAPAFWRCHCKIPWGLRLLPQREQDASSSTKTSTNGPTPKEDKQAQETNEEVVQDQQEWEQPNLSQANADAGVKRPTSTDLQAIWQSHRAGNCRPCIFFRRKADGCQRGDACSHCHFCTQKEAKRRRNKLCQERRVALG